MMKKMLFGLVLAGLFVMTASAAEKVRWPVWFAFNDVDDVDVVGLRLNLPSGQCEQVNGLDLGLIGHSRYFNGLQLNLLRNDVTDALAGWQVGFYNTAARADLCGVQIGLWNQTQTMLGCQIGLVNLSDYAEGCQVGLINRVEGMNGYQLGLVNIIRDSRVPFSPILNIGF